MALAQNINQDIKAAMIAKDNVKLRGLRAIKAAIILAKTEKTQVEELNEQTDIIVLQKLVKQRGEAADLHKNHDLHDVYEIEIEVLLVIEGELPRRLDRAA